MGEAPGPHPRAGPVGVQMNWVGLAWVCQLASGCTGMLARLGVTEAVTCEPFISHSAMAPLSLRHRMSDFASPLKSPIWTMCQDASGATTVPCEVTNPLDATTEPFICHSATWPEVL